MNEVHFSHISDEWITPKSLFRTLDDEFKFGLDPCATPDNAKCRQFYTQEIDGLTRDWHAHASCAFINPPYSQLGKWIEKSKHEADMGMVNVMLIPSRTDTRMFHKHIWDSEKHETRPGVDLRLLKGRQKFGFRITGKMITVVKGFIKANRLTEKEIAKATGLPLMVVRAINANEMEVKCPAPFPSAVVVFRPN